MQQYRSCSTILETDFCFCLAIQYLVALIIYFFWPWPEALCFQLARPSVPFFFIQNYKNLKYCKGITENLAQIYLI